MNLKLVNEFFALPELSRVLQEGQSLKTFASIPKTIHGVWLGSALPSRLQRFRESWRKHHSNWDFKIWSDQDVPELGFEDLLSTTHCFGQKSDILRAEILHRHGGVYVDLDIECYRPIDSLIQQRSFVASLRWVVQAHLGWPAVWPHPLVACNSFFASEAGHPLLADYLRLVRSRWNDRSLLNLKSNELDKVSIFMMGGEKRAAHLKETGLRSYLPFHETVLSYLERREPGMGVLAPEVFNPKLPGWLSIYAIPKFWELRGRTAKTPKFWNYSRKTPNTFGRHWSSASWL